MAKVGGCQVGSIVVTAGVDHREGQRSGLTKQPGRTNELGNQSWDDPGSPFKGMRVPLS